MSADPIGYAEQEESVRALSRHYTGGALDVDAFDSRVRRARAATTRDELAALFADLPEPHPASLTRRATAPSGAGTTPPRADPVAADRAGDPAAPDPAAPDPAATDSAARDLADGDLAAGRPAAGDPGATDSLAAGATAGPGEPTGTADPRGAGHGGDAERTARFAVPGPTRSGPYPDPSGHPAAGPLPDPSPTTAGHRPPWPSPGVTGHPGAGYPGGPWPAWAHPDAGPAGMPPGGGYPGGPAWASAPPSWSVPGRPSPAYPPHPGPPAYGTHGHDPSAPFGREPYSGLPYSDKQKIVTGLLQVFLPFGVGRFYSGHAGLTVAQLIVTFLTFGIGAIWSFVDGIVVLAGSPRDPHGRPLRP
ncbi:DUF1707 domain-containing protein [Pseudonocardia sp. ICBG1293]|uniref:DUF1707 domain-containing protein n=1 Tax=Pseudonocardia sp. ICBG1293 TaxID=2844382 RepID=UPI001CCDB68D|nr:DUF1707 domain-containing protein [Pseudonocardia sp. ICBG1293]